ncbi:hypothetical protein BDZ91DRAFT_725659 [Kalaharituber pfeilii]|nr:hypothetical protein BDZ91DRAFT_725659 [Kalaharituber pfeilii]
MVVMGLDPSLAPFGDELWDGVGPRGQTATSGRNWRGGNWVPSPGYLCLQVPESQCLQVPESQCLQFVVYVFIPPW